MDTVRLVSIASAVILAGPAGAADLARDRPWSGEVRPDPNWLARQGVAAAYPIKFTIDATGRAAGSIEFAGGANPTAGAKAALDGQLGSDGLSMAATLEAGPDLAAAVRAKAEVKVSLTGYAQDDGSLAGVGLINMADLQCITDPATAAAPAPCPRRLVPIKWTAKN